MSCTKCFLAGTGVRMADGSTKDIEDVQVGDEVQTTDPETGKSGHRQVTRLVVTEDDKRFNELSLATDDGVEKLTATDEHPFWSPSEQAWIEAGDLTVGVALLTDAGDTVTGNRAYTDHARTYNLTVDGVYVYRFQQAIGKTAKNEDQFEISVVIRDHKLITAYPSGK